LTQGPTKAQLEEQLKELEPRAAELEQRLAEAEAQRDEYLGNLQRLAADFDNYRKRVARDQESLVTRAHERLAKELLPVLDDLERALDAATKHEEATLEEGVRLVHRALADALAREGLAEIETNGQFDPHVHEALLSQPSDAEEGSVIQVLQKGYRLGDRVLRPARVVIAAAAAQPPVRDSGRVEGDRGNREVPPREEHGGGDR
jgi:molecular chaperone GrpE